MRVQITPAYPPSLSGVGDYAAALVQDGLFEGGRVNTVVASPGSLPKPKTQTTVLPQLTPGTLSSVLEENDTDSVLLHFSGYGYARWGLCYWLVKGLQDWKYRNSDRRITTLFHEVFASGPIWRSSFWTSGMQRSIARELARLSDAGFVTSEAGHSQLMQVYDAKTFEILPVFSTVGETIPVCPLGIRQPQAVVFGGAGTRQRAYDAAAHQEQALKCLFEHLNISELIDIGPGSVAPPKLAGRSVRALGPIAEKDVSDLLARARVGIIDYPGNFLSKSTVAAAYFAHGVLLVNTTGIGKLPADMSEGREFISLDHPMNLEADLEAVAIAGHSWYQPHRIEETVRKIAITL